MLVLGIDDAGRGSVVGPLIVAGFVVDSKKEEELKRLGVKDSKLLSPEKRLELSEELERIAENIIVMRIQPCVIDDWHSKGLSLDKLEAKKMAEIIELSKAEKVYLDALTSRPKKFSKLVQSFLGSKVELVAENFADKKYPVVSAASILAKVERDKAIRELEQKVGKTIGRGYPSDPLTIKFLEELLEEKKKFPAFVRKSWSTAEILVAKKFQKKLLQFLK